MKTNPPFSVSNNSQSFLPRFPQPFRYSFNGVCWFWKYTAQEQRKINIPQMLADRSAPYLVTYQNNCQKP